MSNPVILWIAGLLGWDPGIIVMLVTLAVIFLTGFILMYLINVLPAQLEQKFESSTGAAAAFFGILFALASVVAFFLGLALSVLFLVSLFYLASRGRDWMNGG